MMQIKRTKINLLLSVFFLTLGGAIYIITRPDTYISQLAKNIMCISLLQNKLSFLNSNFFKYYLPDFLWSASFTCALFVINSSIVRVAFISGLIGILWETAQFIGLTDGTGDFHDIIMYLTAIIFVVLINKKGAFKNEKEPY